MCARVFSAGGRPFFGAGGPRAGSKSRFMAGWHHSGALTHIYIYTYIYIGIHQTRPSVTPQQLSSRNFWLSFSRRSWSSTSTKACCGVLALLRVPLPGGLSSASLRTVRGGSRGARPESPAADVRGSGRIAAPGCVGIEGGAAPAGGACSAGVPRAGLAQPRGRTAPSRGVRGTEGARGTGRSGGAAQRAGRPAARAAARALAQQPRQRPRRRQHVWRRGEATACSGGTATLRRWPGMRATRPYTLVACSRAALARGRRVARSAAPAAAAAAG